MRGLLHDDHRADRRNVGEVYVIWKVGFGGYDQAVILDAWSVGVVNKEHGADRGDEVVGGAMAGGDGRDVTKEAGGGNMEFQEGVGDVAGRV